LQNLAPQSPLAGNEIAIPEYGREDLEEEEDEDDYDSEDDESGRGARISQEMFEEL
jgi:hypothetical protein